MQKYGQGNLPQTKQAVVANECPMKCGKETAILVARPPRGSIATWWSRCQRCLAYSETSPAGKVLTIRTVLHTDLCPDCLESKSPTAPHLCATR
jgi:hypothetical protein